MYSKPEFYKGKGWRKLPFFFVYLIVCHFHCSFIADFTSNTDFIMIRTLLAAMAAAAIAFSCSEKEEPDSQKDDSSISATTATIEDFVIDGSTTKTTYQVDLDGKK